jgi:hypothetical protein
VEPPTRKRGSRVAPSTTRRAVRRRPHGSRSLGAGLVERSPLDPAPRPGGTRTRSPSRRGADLHTRRLRPSDSVRCTEVHSSGSRRLVRGAPRLRARRDFVRAPGPTNRLPGRGVPRSGTGSEAAQKGSEGRRAGCAPRAPGCCVRPSRPDESASRPRGAPARVGVRLDLGPRGRRESRAHPPARSTTQEACPVSRETPSGTASGAAQKGSEGRRTGHLEARGRPARRAPRRRLPAVARVG